MDFRLMVGLTAFWHYKPDRGRHPADASGPDPSGCRMGRKKRDLLTFSPAHPTDLTLLVPLDYFQGLF